jgi:integrase
VRRRDNEVLALFARMGLRSGEVAGLQLSDIEWRAGEILVRVRDAERSAHRCRRR